jgi:hypothetical protein
MELSAFVASLQETLGAHLPDMVGALAILIAAGSLQRWCASASGSRSLCSESTPASTKPYRRRWTSSAVSPRARFAADIVGRLLEGMGFDGLPAKLGFAYAFKAPLTASTLLGGIIAFVAMLFAAVEAANRLGFTQVRDLVTMFISFGADALLGALILIVGFWLANVAYKAIDKSSDEGASGLAQIARLAILGLVIAMGLRAMGIASDIVNLAFGLTLGAVAVAVALSFDLGGREAAGKQVEHWLSKLRRGG